MASPLTYFIMSVLGGGTCAPRLQNHFTKTCHMRSFCGGFHPSRSCGLAVVFFYFRQIVRLFICAVIRSALPIIFTFYRTAGQALMKTKMMTALSTTIIKKLLSGCRPLPRWRTVPCRHRPLAGRKLLSE